MKILILGSSGFCGTNLVDYIYENTDWEIYGLDRLPPQKRLPCFKFHLHDLNYSLIESPHFELLSNVDYVINLAAISCVDISIKNPVETIQTNINIVTNLFEFCREIKPQKIIQFSTDEVWCEKMGISYNSYSTRNPYAASKGCQDLIAESYFYTFNLPIAITHSVNIFGPYQNENRFVPKAIKCGLTGQPFPLMCKNVDGKLVSMAKRGWIYVKNVCEYIIKLLKNGKFNNFDHYNITPSFSGYLNNIETLKLIGWILKQNIPLKYIEETEIRSYHDQWYKLVQNYQEKELNVQYKYNLNEGLVETIDFYKRKFN